VRVIATVLAGALAFVLAIAVVVSGPPGGTPRSASALSEIPPDLLLLYMAAAETCPGLPWQVLAAIGYVESHHAQGRANPSTGSVDPPISGPALDGGQGTARIPDPTSPDGWAHAQGPMQFLPSTWARWGRLAPGRPAGAVPTPNNAWDAIYSAAAYLCAGRPALADIDQAILTYNHSTEYLHTVLAKAAEYRLGGEAGHPMPGAGSGVLRRRLRRSALRRAPPRGQRPQRAVRDATRRRQGRRHRSDRCSAPRPFTVRWSTTGG
jgi:hypothetical protein